MNSNNESFILLTKYIQIDVLFGWVILRAHLFSQAWVDSFILPSNFVKYEFWSNLSRCRFGNCDADMIFFRSAAAGQILALKLPPKGHFRCIWTLDIALELSSFTQQRSLQLFPGLSKNCNNKKKRTVF